MSPLARRAAEWLLGDPAIADAVNVVDEAERPRRDTVAGPGRQRIDRLEQQTITGAKSASRWNTARAMYATMPPELSSAGAAAGTARAQPHFHIVSRQFLRTRTTARPA